MNRKDRYIVHSDINHCYAQIEEMKDPGLRHWPMAVGGSTEKRNGIILAKNDLAKRCQIKTGEPLNQALKKCPDLKIIHPDYEAYMYYTEQIKDVYRQYTDLVESFGLDEAWFDLTGSQRLFGDPEKLARRIQQEVYQKFGITVSMGASWNKVFAKLGSDMDKHMGFTSITRGNYKELVWPRAAEDLIMVGRHTEYKLNTMGIFTIGDLARADGGILVRRMGKMGGLLWRYANGLDDSPVMPAGWHDEEKSVGNSKTVVHDITSLDQLYQVFRVLAESTAERLRRIHKKGFVVSVSLRSVKLTWKGKQKRLAAPTDIAQEILAAAFALARQLLQGEPVSLRSVGIQVSDLTADCGFDQISLFDPAPDSRNKQRKLESTIQNIRERYGYNSCRLASVKVDEDLTDFDPLGRLHQVHPIGFLRGPIS